MNIQYHTIRITVTGTAPLNGTTPFTGTPNTGVADSDGVVNYTVIGPIGVFDPAQITGEFNQPFAIQGISVENTVNPHVEGSNVSIQSTPPVGGSTVRKTAFAFTIGGTNGVLPNTNYVIPIDHRFAIDTSSDGGAPGPHVIQFSLARITDDFLNTLLAVPDSNIRPPIVWMKDPVRAASTANVPLATLGPGTVVDGVTLRAGDGVLLKNQAAPSENGPYSIQETAPAVRRSDFSTDAEVRSSMAVIVSEGTVNDDTGWVLATPDPIVLDTTALSFVAFGGSGGGETWAQTLVFGQVSGGQDPTITTGDMIVGQTHLNLTAGTDSNFSATAGDAAGTSGNAGGRALLASGDGDGAGAGGQVEVLAGNGGATGVGGAAMLNAGDAGGGRGGDVSCVAGNAAGTGRGGDVNLTAGNPAGVDQDGGDIQLTPTAETGSGDEGTAWVGNQAIITTITNTGGGDVSIAKAKGSGTIHGANVELRDLTGTGGILLTQNVDDITVDGSGISPTIESIQVSRSTSFPMTGVPTGLSFDRRDSPPPNPAIFIWVAGSSDVTIGPLGAGVYRIKAEVSSVITGISWSSVEIDSFINGGLDPALTFANSSVENTFNEENDMSYDIVRTLAVGNTVGPRVHIIGGTSTSIIANTARLSLEKLS